MEGLNQWGEWEGIAYGENRSRIDPESLACYLGEWLAWDLTGTRSLAHHADAAVVAERLRELGVGSDRVVMEHLVRLYADD